jgi:D-lactate dehydrogenase (cytochrome)
MNRVRNVSAEDNTLIAEAGVVLANAQKAADEAGRLFPLSLAAEGSSTIGGNVSTNAGGVNVLRYGMTRELVLGLEVVLADGRVLDLMRGLRKDNTGYDLKQLFIGAEGTLGIVTAAQLKLFPKPAGHTTALAALAGVEHAVDLLNRLQAATGGLVTAFELMQRRALDLVTKHIPGTVNPLPAHAGWTVLIEVSNPSAFDATEALEQALANAMEEGTVVDAVFAKTARDRGALWRLRESIPEAQRADGASSPTTFRCRCRASPISSAKAKRRCAACCRKHGPSPSAMSATEISISRYRRRATMPRCWHNAAQSNARSMRRRRNFTAPSRQSTVLASPRTKRSRFTSRPKKSRSCVR